MKDLNSKKQPEFTAVDARDVVEDIRGVLNHGLLRNQRLIAVFRDVVIDADRSRAAARTEQVSQMSGDVDVDLVEAALPSLQQPL